MNLTSLITLPARLGYEVARRTIDIVSAAARLVGVDGGGAERAPESRPSHGSRRPRAPKAGMDDSTLTHKVETQIFRIRGAAKGKIDVNAADGVIWLRGEARTPALIKQIEAKAASIPEVKGVENLLHLPKTPSPTRTDTPPSQRRTRSSTRRAAPKSKAARGRNRTAAERRRGAPPKRTTAEKRTAPAEPAPARLAAAGQGRQPAPLGSGPAEVGQPDDVTLTRKVESQIFREGYAPKGSVNVNAVDGVVWLRGQVKSPDEIRELQRRALSVPGVKRIENLLHLPETPAPAAEPAGEAGDRAITGRFTAEEPGDGEPLPTDLADRGEGRQPAPLGASDDAPGGGGGGDARTAIP